MTYMTRFLNNKTFELEDNFIIADTTEEAERLTLEAAAEYGKSGRIVAIYEVKKVK